MKTIYKSIALEAALLSVTLALQAEIQSEGETVTVDVQASSLDRLKVTLVSPNVSGARDLVASGNATIDGSEISVNLENLAFGTHRLVVSARFGTQIRTLYALDISVPQAELPNETQEYEDAAIVVSTYGDGGGGEFPTDYAKQGDDPTATLTDTQAYAQAAAEDAAAAKTAAQALSPVASAADAYNTGKAELAANITAKGVEASASETLPQLAQKVTAIAQQPIILSPSEVGDMYAKQLYGSLTTPNYWNLYEVLNMLLNDGRLINYGGILLAEYYKGYDSLALSGAGAGGAYVVSDMENGVFKMYTEDTTHVWSTEFDGRGNRWVAYCFADEYHDFQITDTNTSPRSIFIGRKVGTITSLVNGRVSRIVVPDGNELKNVSGQFTQQWGKRVVIRNLSDFNSGALLWRAEAIEDAYIGVDRVSGGVLLNAPSSGGLRWQLKSIIFDINEITGNSALFGQGNNALSFNNITDIILKANGSTYFTSSYNSGQPFDGMKNITIISEELIIRSQNTTPFPSTTKMRFGYVTNDKTKSIHLVTAHPDLFNVWRNITYMELQENWNKPINISVAVSLTEATLYTYILQRLKQDEPDCGDGVTITLGQTNLDKLTSQESTDLLDTLTNTYGYTFA